MRRIDEQEEKIVRELIRNPRNSDNAISKKTKIPVMTVNRKRKQMEKEGLLRYYLSFNSSRSGTGSYNVKQLYIIKFRIGITREDYVKKVEINKKLTEFKCTYINQAFLGEKDGSLALITMVDASSDGALVEEFNGKFVPYLQSVLGENCIKEITVAKVSETLRRHHNYQPHINMENGTIKNEWPNEYIFVDEPLYKVDEPK